jgi:hypothetical protein
MPTWLHLDPVSVMLIAGIAWFVRGKFTGYDDHVDNGTKHWTEAERKDLRDTMHWIQTDLRNRNGG